MGFWVLIYLAGCVVVAYALYAIIRAGVKDGIKAALQDLKLLDKAAVRTIDVQNKDGGGGDSGSYI